MLFTEFIFDFTELSIPLIEESTCLLEFDHAFDVSDSVPDQVSFTLRPIDPKIFDAPLFMLSQIFPAVFFALDHKFEVADFAPSQALETLSLMFVNFSEAHDFRLSHVLESEVLISDHFFDVQSFT